MGARVSQKAAACWERLSVLSDCLLLGMLVAAASIPLLTAPAAFAAACAVVHGWRGGESPKLVATFRAMWSQRPKAHLAAGLGFVIIAVVLAADLVLAATVLPGGPVLRWAVVAAAVGVGAVLMGGAAAVGATGTGWRAALRGAVAGWRDRPGRFLLLSLGVAAAAVLVWALPPVLFVVAGPLALAATGCATLGGVEQHG